MTILKRMEEDTIGTRKAVSGLSTSKKSKIMDVEYLLPNDEVRRLLPSLHSTADSIGTQAEQKRLGEHAPITLFIT